MTAFVADPCLIAASNTGQQKRLNLVELPYFVMLQHSPNSLAFTVID